MPNQLFVTLKNSDNKCLSYPCKGWLELFELGVSGSVIVGVWRGLQHDGSLACPVEVRRVEFEYAGGQVKSSQSLDARTLVPDVGASSSVLEKMENNMQLSHKIYDLLPRDSGELVTAIEEHLADAVATERRACADIALALDSLRGNEKEISSAILRRVSAPASGRVGAADPDGQAACSAINK